MFHSIKSKQNHWIRLTDEPVSLSFYIPSLTDKPPSHGQHFYIPWRATEPVRLYTFPDWRAAKPALKNHRALKVALHCVVAPYYKILYGRWTEREGMPLHHGELRWCSGHICTSHHCDLGSILGSYMGWDWLISVWLTGIISGFSGFPPSIKITFTPKSVLSSVLITSPWLAFHDTLVCDSENWCTY